MKENDGKSFRDRLHHVGERINHGLNVAYLWFRRLLDHHGFLILACVIGVCALAVRYALTPFPSGDLSAFIFPWLKNFRENGHLSYLSQMQGDYPPAYMTLLALISYLPAGPEVTNVGAALTRPYPMYDIYYVKTLSFIFDFVLALGCYAIATKLQKDNKLLRFVAFVVPLLLPTVITNSGIWGQCDAIYVSLIVWSVYFIISNKQATSMIFFGLALAFKLQSIFILPLFGFLWLRKRFQLRYLLVAVLVTFCTFIPCYLAGAPFVAPFEKYGSLTVSYPAPNYNSGSLYSFINNIFWQENGETSTQLATYNLIHYGGLFFGFTVALVTMFVFYARKIKPTNQAITAIAAFYAIVMPFVLPHMHERYFFMADIFIVVYCLVTKRRYWLIPLMQLSSIITYMPFIFNTYFIFNWGIYSVRIATIINFVIIAVLFKDVWSLPRYEENQSDLIAIEETPISAEVTNA